MVGAFLSILKADESMSFLGIGFAAAPIHLKILTILAQLGIKHAIHELMFYSISLLFPSIFVIGKKNIGIHK